MTPLHPHDVHLATPGTTEESLRLLVESVKDYAIIMLDADGHVATWNAGAEHIKGYQAAEIIGQHFSVFYAPEDRAACKPESILRRAAGDGRAADEGWRIRKGGSRFWADVVVTALRDPSGTLVGYAKVTRDLTERRGAARALRESEERFARVLNGSPIAICIFSATADRVLEANPRFAELLGYGAPAALAGKSAVELGIWTRAEHERVLGELRKQRSVREAELHFRTRSGNTSRALAALELINMDGEDCVLALFWRR